MGLQAQPTGVDIMSKQCEWNFSKDKQLPTNDDLLWLYKNYVLDCPTPGVSIRGRTLSEMGWKGTDYRQLVRSISQSCGLDNAHWKYVERPRKGEPGTERERFIETLNNCSLLNCYTLDHEFAIYMASGRIKMDALFYMVRNCLAHGSFRIHNHHGNTYIAMQSSKNGTPKGRALLTMKTLRTIRRLSNNPSSVLESE